MVGNAAVFLVAFNENVTQSTLAAGNLTVANGGTPTVIPINFRSFEVKIVPQSLSSPVTRLPRVAPISSRTTPRILTSR